MANTNPFTTAHYARIALDKQTAKRVQFVYAQAAKDIKHELKTLKIINPSDNLKKTYLEGLMRNIDASIDGLQQKLQDIVINAGDLSGQLAVSAGNNYMKLCGLKLEAFNYVPAQEVKNIVSGKLYGGNWSLSHALWKTSLRTKSDIEKVVAKGLAENKSIKDIADALTKYVDPSARKPWDWNKVYPGTAAKVDYNAQRLARTMIQHAYEQSLVQSQLYNPFCHGIIWHSVGEHGRTCPECLDRDGNVYPVKDLPLDHPNGLCYFEPALDDMNTVADRLADWANGAPDPEIDQYVTKGLGIKLSSKAGQSAIAQAKAGVGNNKPFNETDWIDGVKKNTEKHMLGLEEKLLGKLSPKQFEAIQFYTGYGYGHINDFLRGVSTRIPDRAREAITSLKSAFRKLTSKEALYLRRGSSTSDLASLMGGSYEANKQMLSRVLYADDLGAAVADLNNKVAGTVGTLKAYTSTSSIWDRGFRGRVEYIFKTPKGTKGSSIMTISKYGTAEGEFLLSADTRVKVVHIAKSDGHKDSIIRVFLEVIV